MNMRYATVFSAQTLLAVQYSTHRCVHLCMHVFLPFQIDKRHHRLIVWRLRLIFEIAIHFVYN